MFQRLSAFAIGRTECCHGVDRAVASKFRRRIDQDRNLRTAGILSGASRLSLAATSSPVVGGDPIQHVTPERMSVCDIRVVEIVAGILGHPELVHDVP